MKECPNCHAQIEDDSLFCTECGKPFPQENTCPHCGTQMNEGDPFCQNCGKKPDEENVANADSKCPNCGSPLNDGDLFCQNCGKKLNEESVANADSKCPNCGSPLNDGDLFCQNCGKKLDEENVANADSKCPNCGSPMNDGDLFCQNCGKKLDEENDFNRVIDNSIRCPHCGTPANIGDLFCQNCGSSIVGGTPATSLSGQPVGNQHYERSTGSSNIGTILLYILGLFFLAAILVGGFWYYKYDYLPQKEAKEARIQAEQEKAAAIHERDSLDQALWEKTIAKDESAAYELYLEKFPEGKHAEQAQKRLDYEEKLRLTDSEEYRVSEAISYFFNNLAGGYEDSMISYLNPNLSTFLGKKNATKVDAIAYMKKIHSDDVYSVDITMGDIEVKKSLIDNEEPVYTATFTYDQRLEREDTSLETFASIKGTATLNKNFKITSLSLSKTATY